MKKQEHIKVESIQYIDKLVRILSGDEEISKYFKDKIHWANARKNNWNNDKIRVGVIGVTSSGKSTLINALLGSDILSSAVAPSSGQLVCCSYGTEYLAKVSFTDKNDVVLKGTEFSVQSLMEFSDERRNPKNEKHVQNIEIQSPKFDLPKDILLIDSPGLDAYGLEIHEKLTLETLVPTIDVCIYVTTMKTNSDQKIYEILNVIGRYGCPLVIVQNMLDSVRPSPSGDKSAEEIAHEHYMRLKKIVEKTAVKSKGDIDIVQISAQYAKQWKLKQSEVEKRIYDRSNYETFLKTVNNFLNYQKPEIECQRINSIQNTVNDLIQEISSKIDETVSQEENKIDYSNVRGRIQMIQKEAKQKFDRISTEFAQKAERLSQDKKKVTEDTIQNFTNNVNLLVNTAGENIRKLIEKYNSDLTEIATELNIPVRDILCMPAFANYPVIHIREKVVTNIDRVKKDGLGGRILRFFGRLADEDWGYCYEETEDVVVCVAETLKDLKIRLSNAKKHYSEVYQNWLKGNFEVTCKKLLNEIDSAETAYMNRQKKVIENEKLLAIQTQLVNLKSKIDNYSDGLLQEKNKRKQKAKIIRDNKVKKYELNEYTKTLINIAHQACIAQHHAIMRKWIAVNKLMDYDAIIVGWDKYCLEDFKNQSGLVEASVFELSKNRNINIKSKRHRCFCILVNATQIGAAEKQIHSLKLKNVVVPDDYIMWIVQDFQEIINGGNVKEALQKVMDFADNYLNNIRNIVWIVHDNPIYNISFLMYQGNGGLKSIKEENEFLSSIKKKYPEYCNDYVISNIGKMIRNTNR